MRSNKILVKFTRSRAEKNPPTLTSTKKPNPALYEKQSNLIRADTEFWFSRGTTEKALWIL